LMALVDEGAFREFPDGVDGLAHDRPSGREKNHTFPKEFFRRMEIGFFIIFRS